MLWSSKIIFKLKKVLFKFNSSFQVLFTCQVQKDQSSSNLHFKFKSYVGVKEQMFKGNC